MNIVIFEDSLIGLTTELLSTTVLKKWLFQILVTI